MCKELWSWVKYINSCNKNEKIIRWGYEKIRLKIIVLTFYSCKKQEIEIIVIDRGRRWRNETASTSSIRLNLASQWKSKRA